MCVCEGMCLEIKSHTEINNVIKREFSNPKWHLAGMHEGYCSPHPDSELCNKVQVLTLTDDE